MYSRLACFLIAGVCVYAADSNTDPRSQEAEQLIQKGRFLDAAQMFRDVDESARTRGIEDAHLANSAADLGGVYVFLDR